MKTRLLSMAVVVVLLSGCGSGHRFSEIEETAYHSGEDAARVLIDSVSGMSELQFEGYLLGVRARQYSYVEAGDTAEASAFITGFEEYLKANSDSLSALIF